MAIGMVSAAVVNAACIGVVLFFVAFGKMSTVKASFNPVCLSQTEKAERVAVGGGRFASAHLAPLEEAPQFFHRLSPSPKTDK